MALNFPDSPTLNQVFSVNDRQWTWDGTSWNLTLSGTTQARWTKTATAGQTVASGLSNSSTTLTYTIGSEEVFLNGTLLVRGSDYTATNGTSITFVSPLAASDVIEVVSYGSMQINTAVNLSNITGQGELFVGTGVKTVGVLDAGSVNQVLTAYPDAPEGVAWIENDIIPIDTLRYKFDGIESRFMPTYQGMQIPITNPLRVFLSVNGVNQTSNFPEYVWKSGLPREGFVIDSDGYIAFSEVPPVGSTFEGRVMTGSPVTTYTKTYPFDPTDIVLGG
jgi:hypothetical protein